MRNLVQLILLISINTMFEAVSIRYGYKRYFLSAEFLLGIFFLSMNARFIGFLIILGAFLIEMMLGVSSVFYLYEVDQIWDMLSFLGNARGAYLLQLGLFASVLGLLSFLIFHFGKGSSKKTSALMVMMLASMLLYGQWRLSWEEQTFFSPTLAARKDLLFGINYRVLSENMMINRNQIMGDRVDKDAEYFPIEQPSAVKLAWGERPSAQRVLLVIAESWGVPKNREALSSQIGALVNNPNIEELELSEVYARGATATGELRELCGLIPNRLNFRKLTAESIGRCLPRDMLEHGYKTVGIHGAYGGMYRRSVWWPEVGLNDVIFKESMPLNTELCSSFPGYCDRDILKVVEEKLKSDKVFVYWMTLNSHMPYDRSDVIEYRAQLCKYWSGAEDFDSLCNYQNLHTQFFEGLSMLAKNKEMKGVEVLVVGDHPPLFDKQETREKFSRDKVSVLKFKIK